MTKEKLIENLRDEASQKVRLHRKTKQLMVTLKSLLILYTTFCIVAWFFLPQSSELLSMLFKVSVFTVCLAIVIILIGAIILPFGKSTKEKIDEAFKELVSTRIKSKKDYISKIQSGLIELEQEIEILEEL
ncbi:MAG: hypothetical protein Q8Q67_01090 [bacterium]|nr:hypothetical protein [bacterium]